MDFISTIEIKNKMYDIDEEKKLWSVPNNTKNICKKPMPIISGYTGSWKRILTKRFSVMCGSTLCWSGGAEGLTRNSYRIVCWCWWCSMPIGLLIMSG